MISTSARQIGNFQWDISLLWASWTATLLKQAHRKLRRNGRWNLFLGQRIPLAGVAHQNGTVRFGNDPKTSALDRNCKAHELDNLYVVDASFFCSSGAVNPALTIIANALRVGDHLLERTNAQRQEPELAATV